MDDVLQGCLESAFTLAPPRVLDPSCGDGAFIIGALEALCRQSPEAARTAAGRLRLVASQLFGVDSDASAIECLRRRVRERIHPDGEIAAETDAVLRENFRSGDALLGPDFDRGGADVSVADGAIDWGRAFPAAAAAGGFDAVVGNPPYRRERHTQALFEQIARSPLGRRWRAARMDLWHYFVHRGLDLLRPAGRLSFIVSSYWLAARSAQPLIARLADETTLQELVLLGRLPVFEGVAGRHMILKLRKGRRDAPCRVVDVAGAGTLEGALAQLVIGRSALPSAPGVGVRLLSQEALYRHGQIVAGPATRPRKRSSQRPLLGEQYEVRQGIAENPPRVTSRMRREFGESFVPGAGVFVLTDQECAELNLAPRERRLLHPYYATAAVGRYALSPAPTHRLLYLTPRTAATLDGLPSIAAHLGRYRAVMERRRETRQGSLRWWHLHWPREERLFVEPRILSVQMGRTPQFVAPRMPTFVGFSLHVLLARDATVPALDALTGVLNSARAARWFLRHGKQRGVCLDISGMLLKRFPLPRRDAGIERELARLVDQRQTVVAGEGAAVMELEAGIERLVGTLYDGHELDD